MSSKIPPPLEPYLALPPEASLVLLTSVLGASTNWLVLRYLHRALIHDGAASLPSADEGAGVVLVSFMRDFTFWRENAKRMGLDLENLSTKRRFACVDGLTGLFLPTQQEASGRTAEYVLGSPSLSDVSRVIRNAVRSLQSPPGSKSKVLLVIDQPDLILATTGDEIGPVHLGNVLLDLREEVHSMLVTLSADAPSALAQQTRLEIDHAAFLLSVAHQADMTLSLRRLDSGTARDVSGVIRITTGEGQCENDRLQKRVEERELLYFVGGDGGVKVFERGQ
ncbi:hypothetical protein BJ875DRAFT_442008 [Amylocarpus encephaloides]|uniref:Elongator complex protein 6 n=1 Tax=Amylocarpus encephaloides TaxID=45428 RepID=A0A9P8C4Z3_9HELO|nr:hypothetical protein BJ875DRAFT_442008 [Amylocarpus encephaloides]